MWALGVIRARARPWPSGATPQLQRPDLQPGRPTVVIADTVRNKGLPSLEGKPERWFVKLTPPEVEQLIAELHGAAACPLSSQPLVVR